MKHTLLLLFFIFSSFCYSQEICNNGIDDDGDGKIDLNDSDCICNNTASILPNFSFEEKTHCPYSADDLSMVLSWVKGTQPSPDYMSCEKYYAIYNKKLENFPDGDGIIRAVCKNSQKEYLATKLPTSLIAGTKYQLKLNIATLTSIDISQSINTEYDFDYLEPVNITLFGCNNRDNLPLYTNSSPDTFDPTWIEIGHVTYQPQSVWGEITSSFTPNVDINSIMLGAPSGKLPPSFDTLESPSFLYDKLILNTAENFGATISQTGSFCNGNLELTATITKILNSSTAYQWYKDGIAISGATNKTYKVTSIPLNVGSYSVKITNGNDCFVSSNLTINNSLSSPETIVTQPSCTEIKGSITVKETGLNYSFDNGKSWQATPVYIPAGPGKYYVKTKSASGCISTPAIVTIIDPVLLDRPSFSIVQPTCSANGSITITSPASKYSFDNGLTWSTTSTKNNLPAGNYNIKIKNNLGCESYSRSIFLFTPHLDYPTYTFTIPTCNSGGTITITTPASEYSFDNGVTWTTNPTATDLDPGYYSIKIKNESGCESNTPLEYVYLKKFYVPYPKVKKVDPTCEKLGSIRIVTVADQYSFDGGATWTTNPNALNLESGYYIVKTKNELGCESEPNYVFIHPYYLQPAEFTIVQPSCSSNGSLTITTPAYEYSFDNGVTWTKNPTVTVSNVFTQFYIVLKNEFGCKSEYQYAYVNANLYSGSQTTYTINKNVTCDSGASVTITSPGSEFSFDDGKTWSANPTAVNLEPNAYDLKSRDANGCFTDSKRIYLFYPYLDFPTYSVIQPDCNTKGSITITTVADFYSFDGGVTWETNSTKTNLEEGNYEIILKNIAGCTSIPFNIHINSTFFQYPYYSIVQPTVCGDNATGSITIITPAAFYSFNDGATWSTNPTATNLPIGSEYRLKIKNSSGCVSESIYVNFIPFELKNTEYTYIDPTCDKGGSITITTPAPFYSFDGGETWGTNPTALNLPMGFYVPTIRNEFGCISVSSSIRFNEPKLSYPSYRITQPKCGSPGSIIIDTPATQYSFDGGRTWSTSNKVLNIPASINSNNYGIMIKDESGCESYQAIATIYAVYLDPPDYTTTKPICGLGGSITINTIGAEYSFDNGMTWSTNPTATDLDEGNYFIIWKNELGCQSYPVAVYIPKFYLADPLFTITQPNCDVLGSIKVTTSATEYSIDNGINWFINSTFSDLKPGNYNLKIKNELGCESNTKYISLTNLNPLPEKPIISVQQPSSCTAAKGTITVLTNAYQYSFDDGLNWTANPIATNLISGNYFVKIKNSATGCASLSVKATINPPLDAVITPNYTVSQPVSCTNPFGTITITTIASKYSFDNGITWKTNSDSGNLASGNYKIKIQNAAGCESEAVSIQINTPTDYPPVPTYSIIQPNCTNSQGKITITSPASEYSFDNGINWTNNATSLFLNPGEYYLKTKNSKGCISEAIKATIIPFVSSIPAPEYINSKIFCIQQNAILNNIQITGQNIKWYNTQTSGVLLPNTTLLQNNITYYASQTINGCESERVAVTITIQNTLAPTGNTNQLFCSGQYPTIANLEITGSLLRYYDTLNNGNLLAETTNLQDGKTYYVSQTINNCEGPRFAVTVSIVNTPSVPTANAAQSFCKSENATLNDIQISGQNIKWYDTNFAAAVLPNTTLLENNRTYYASQTIGCEGDRTPVLIHVYDTALPIGNSNQQFCIDAIATIENLSIQGTAIKWYDAAVNGNILSETDLLQNGIYYASQTLNNCESKRLAVTVKIQDTQNPLSQTPQTFCVQENASISDIKISGENIKWFESNSSNTILSESTSLQNGITYYASQTINNCESDRIPITIYILEATTADCINFVDELPYPKFFTPNNDGYNDTWTIDFAYLAPRTGIKIFDRYGKFIKELYENGVWDGNYLGKQEPGSDYWFSVTRLNGTEFRGHFSLKR